MKNGSVLANFQVTHADPISAAPWLKDFYCFWQKLPANSFNWDANLMPSLRLLTARCLDGSLTSGI